VTSVDDLIVIYETEGARRYGGEQVSQLAHALQCAALAEGAGAPPPLVAACFLHDLGHLLAARARGSRPEADDRHEYRALPFLAAIFGEAVLEPIRLHVDAKRYLCFAGADYWARLSPASQRSLALQGGAFTGAEADRFAAQPHAMEAVRLRRWDDLAKTPGAETPRLTHDAAILRVLASA